MIGALVMATCGALSLIDGMQRAVQQPGSKSAVYHCLVNNFVK